MSGEELQAALEALGLSQRDLARLLAVPELSVQRWRAGASRVPPPVAVWLRLMLARPELLSDAWWIAGYPGKQKSRAGRPARPAKVPPPKVIVWDDGEESE